MNQPNMYIICILFSLQWGFIHGRDEKKYEEFWPWRHILCVSYLDVWSAQEMISSWIFAICTGQMWRNTKWEAQQKRNFHSLRGEWMWFSPVSIQKTKGLACFFEWQLLYVFFLVCCFKKVCEISEICLDHSLLTLIGPGSGNINW